MTEMEKEFDRGYRHGVGSALLALVVLMLIAAFFGIQ